MTRRRSPDIDGTVRLRDGVCIESKTGRAVIVVPRQPRADLVARRFQDGRSAAGVAVDLGCNLEDVERALRRRFDQLEKKRKAKR